MHVQRVTSNHPVVASFLNDPTKPLPSAIFNTKLLAKKSSLHLKNNKHKKKEEKLSENFQELLRLALDLINYG